MLKGCTDHNCIIVKPKGIGTNGGCKCLHGLETRTRINIERKIQLMEKTIKAQAKLLMCYRLGGKPPEWVFGTLDMARKNGMDV